LSAARPRKTVELRGGILSGFATQWLRRLRLRWCKPLQAAVVKSDGSERCRKGGTKIPLW